jgi:hypothetical protein
MGAAIAVLIEVAAFEWQVPCREKRRCGCPTVELKDRGIRVNTLSPGATDTPIIDSQYPTKE